MFCTVCHPPSYMCILIWRNRVLALFLERTSSMSLCVSCFDPRRLPTPSRKRERDRRELLWGCRRTPREETSYIVVTSMMDDSRSANVSCKSCNRRQKEPQQSGKNNLKASLTKSKSCLCCLSVETTGTRLQRYRQSQFSL